MELRILGCHSATPKPGEFPTSQALLLENQWLILDAGEGMQMQLRRYGVKFSRIKHIFISHLHGDHLYGLFGFLSTLRLLGRVTELHLYAPEDLDEALKTLFKISQVELTYPLFFHPLKSNAPEVILNNEKFSVRTIPLLHRIYTNGFLIEEKPKPRKINKEALNQYPGLESWAYHLLKQGKDITLEDGRVIPNEELTLPPPPPKKYAYCTDTKYHPDIVPIIQGADVLYHEATFAETEKDLAEQTFHSTAKQAAMIAKEAGVKKLIIGHFSSRYRDLNILLEEARSIFPATELAFEGKQIVF